MDVTGPLALPHLLHVVGVAGMELPVFVASGAVVGRLAHMVGPAVQREVGPAAETQARKTVNICLLRTTADTSPLVP